MTRFLLSFWRLRVSSYGAPSLTRGWVSNLLVQLLLGLVRAVTLGSKSRRTHGHILLSHLILPQPGGPGPRIYIPQETGGPVVSPGTVFPSCRLLRLSGLLWSYSNQFPHGLTHVCLMSKSKSKSKSKSCYYWRSVSQYVLGSSSLWNLWPDIIFYLKVAVLCLWGALSDERAGLSLVNHCQQCLVLCQKCNILYFVHVTCFMHIQYIRGLCQIRLSTADHAPSVAYATTAV
jgi:hypothetical protein